MIVKLQDMLKEAEKNNFAIASINTPNQISLRAVLKAAEDTDMPITINHAQTEEDVVPQALELPLMLEYAEKSKAAVAVHVDHGYDFNYVMEAIRLGVTSIMYDQSRFPLEKNIEETKRMVDICHPLGIAVEAELGAMPNNMPTKTPGQEDSDLSDLTKYFTDPDQVAEFCERTGVDVLTTSFGTVHGMYAGTPNLHIDLVKKFKKNAENVTLGMHGGSGTPYNQIQAAIDAGIKKINYFTAIDTAPAPVLKKMLDEATGPVNFYNIANKAMEVIYNQTVEVLTVFKNQKKF